MTRFFALLLLVSLLFCACDGVYTTDEMNGVRIDVEQSWLSDFSVSDDLVYIYCTVHVENPSNNEVKVQFIGSFTEDYEAGLLAENQIIGRCNGESTIIVPIGGGTFDIVFCGDYGGTPCMQNRLLPEIELVIVG